MVTDLAPEKAKSQANSAKKTYFQQRNNTDTQEIHYQVLLEVDMKAKWKTRLTQSLHI